MIHLTVIPANAGIQCSRFMPRYLDTGVRRYDEGGLSFKRQCLWYNRVHPHFRASMKVVVIMSQTSSRFFDEFAKLMTNAAGAAQGVRQEVDTLFKAQAERVLREIDVVSREEFDAFREMAVKARVENEALEKRIVELESALAKLTPVKKAKTPASKRPKPRAAKKK